MDDEPVVLEILENFFTREPGFSVKSCSNATDALEILNAHQIDAVIADFGLPDMDGINLLRETRAGDFPVFLSSLRVNIAPMLPLMH